MRGSSCSAHNWQLHSALVWNCCSVLLLYWWQYKALFAHGSALRHVALLWKRLGCCTGMWHCSGSAWGAAQARPRVRSMCCILHALVLQSIPQTTASIRSAPQQNPGLMQPAIDLSSLGCRHGFGKERAP